MIPVEHTIEREVSLENQRVRKMTVLDRPSAQEIDTAIRQILTPGREIGFPELEQAVQQRLPNLASPMQVRQAAWRLVRSRVAEVTSGLRVKST